jgi:hypothetical protein
MALFTKKPYVGGILILIHKSGLDLAGATYVINAQKPDLTTIVTKSGTRVGDTDKIKATFLPTDIDQAGEWSFQLVVTYSGQDIVPCRVQKQMIYARYF